MTAAVDLYGRGLHETHREVVVRYADGSCRDLPLRAWCADEVDGDAGLVERCSGATLDVGCGPGRLTVAVARRGLPALGVDVAPGALAVARRRGALVLGRSVFDPLPASGRWDTVLLADGNVGIGGDPVALLRRVAALLAPAGRALVEVDPPEAPTVRTTVRLEEGDLASGWFPWAHVAAPDVDALAADSGLAVTERWQEVGRWFAALETC